MSPVFDVNALEREGGPIELFRFKLGDRDFMMGDPREMLFDDLYAILVEAAAGHVVSALAKLVPLEDRDDFLAEAKKIPVWKLTKLSKASQEHYGMKLPESSASPPS